MRGHNVNIYFTEKNYNKIKPLITQRKISKFVNQAIEKELVQQQEKQQVELKEKLIAAHQRISQNKKLKKELAVWDETVDDYINKG